MSHQTSPFLASTICLALSFPCHAGKIHDAVAKRDPAALDRALKTEPKQVNARCYPDFDTPLYLAVAAGDHAIVKRLMDAGADPGMKQPCFPRVTPVQRAVFLVGDKPNRELPDLAVVDLLASSKETIEPPSVAIKLAKDLYQQIFDDLAAVPDTEMAARLEVLSILLSRKSDLNHGFKGSLPPLHMAVTTGNLEVMRMLIKSGTDVNSRDDTYWMSPLSAAVMLQPRREVISALLDAGARTDFTYPDAKEHHPRTLIEYARQNGSPEIIELLENPPHAPKKKG